MSTVLAFDVYGTLIDTQGINEQLQELVGDQTSNFSQRCATSSSSMPFAAV